VQFHVVVLILVLYLTLVLVIYLNNQLDNNTLTDSDNTVHKINTDLILYIILQCHHKSLSKIRKNVKTILIYKVSVAIIKYIHIIATY